MYSRQTSYPLYSGQQHYSQRDIDLHQRMSNLERQLETLIKMVEYNNQMLRYMHQNNFNSSSSSGGGGGGAIIVRM